MMTMERLLSFCHKDGECLICMLNPAAIYPLVKSFGPAHRYAWFNAKGEIPKGMLVCHKCDTPRCINVDHLFLGTPQDNMTDKVNKGRLVAPGAPKLIPKKELDKILELRQQGKSFKEIGELYRVHRRTVARFIAASIPLPTRDDSTVRLGLN